MAWLVKESAERSGLSPEEAKLVAQKGLDFLHQATGRGINQIVFPLVAVEYGNYRQSYAQLPKRPVVLTPFAPDDLEIYREYGLKAMQNARLLRLVEEAYRQGAVFDQPHLSLLTNITAKSIRSRLVPLWARGIRLPLTGQAERHRRARMFRSTYALKMALAGERPGVIRKELFASASQWQSWQLEFARVATLAERAAREEIIWITGLGPQPVDEYLEVARQAPQSYLLRLKNSFGIGANLAEQDPAARFLGILEAEHNFSPAKARAFLRLLEEYGQEHTEHRPSGTVIYHAVSDQEPPGKPISECRLIPVKLTLVSPEDEAYLNPDATSRLKWQRILRYTTEAKAQGAYLSQPDLVFLLGVSRDTSTPMMICTRSGRLSLEKPYAANPSATRPSKYVVVVSHSTRSGFRLKRSHTRAYNASSSRALCSARKSSAR